MLKTRQFRSEPELVDAAADLLQERMEARLPRPHAVMLSGGKTPLPVYAEVARRRVVPDERLFLLQSDERMVPADSPESNYGQTGLLRRALGLTPERVLRVETELATTRAAARYDEALGQFLKSGGRITLGFLGLGADGHTASLFTLAEVRRGRGQWAMGVPRPIGPARVSVTPDFLARVEVLIFLVAGAAKRAVVKAMTEHPERLAAGQAVRDAANVQMWVADV